MASLADLARRTGSRLIDRNIARGFPFAAATLFSALAGLGSVVVLTRLLGAQGYGYYMTALAGIGVVQNTLFFWVQTGVTRFHSRTAPDALAGSANRGFLLSAVFAIGSWIAIAAFSLPDLKEAWLPGLVLLLARGWLAVGQAWARVRGQVGRFVAIETVQSLGSLALAALVLWWTGSDVAAALWACVAAAVVGIALAGTVPWLGGADDRFRTQLRAMWTYGGPLILVSLAAAALAGVDRLLVARLLGPAAVASYTVGYAIADRAVGLLLAPLALALKPTVFKAFDSQGEAAAHAATATQAVWLVGLSLPAAVFVSVMAFDLTHLLAPASIAAAAAKVVPWIAASSLLLALLNLHFALAFQISRKTIWMLAAVGPAALLDILANAVLLPRFGVIAAAWASLGSCLLALLLAVAIGRRHFAIPFPVDRIAKVVVASGALMLFLQIDFGSGAQALLIAAGGGALVYLAVLAGLSARLPNVVD